MAIPIEIIHEGIILSHDLSANNYTNLYDPTIDEIPRLDVDKLIYTVLERLSKVSDIDTIELKIVDCLPYNNLYGAVEFEGNVAKIYTSSNLNKCWERFTIVKEIVQLYIDHEYSYKKFKGVNVLNQLIDLSKEQDKFFIDGAKMDFENSYNDDVYPEFQAIIMATDLIFPYCKKDGFINNIFDFIIEGRLKYYDIAYLMRMPEFAVKAYHLSLHKISLELKESRDKLVEK